MKSQAMKVLTLSVLCLLIIGWRCPFQPDSSSPAKRDYLPLRIGNTWEYNSNADMNKGRITETWTVTEEEIIHDKTWYKVDRYLHTSGVPPYSRFDYYRYEGDKLYTAHVDTFMQNGTTSFQEYLLADFSKAKGESFQSDRGEATFSVRVIRKQNDEIELFYDIPTWADEEYTIVFKKKVGVLTHYSNAWGAGIWLKSYNLN